MLLKHSEASGHARKQDWPAPKEARRAGTQASKAGRHPRQTGRQAPEAGRQAPEAGRQAPKAGRHRRQAGRQRQTSMNRESLRQGFLLTFGWFLLRTQDMIMFQHRVRRDEQTVRVCAINASLIPIRRKAYVVSTRQCALPLLTRDTATITRLEEVALELELSGARHKPPIMYHPFQRGAILAPLSSAKIGPMRADSPSARQPYWVRDPPLQWPSARIVHQGTWSRSRCPPSRSVQRSVLNSFVRASPVEIVCLQDPCMASDTPSSACALSPVACPASSMPNSRHGSSSSSASIFHGMCSSISGSAGSLCFVIGCGLVPG